MPDLSNVDFDLIIGSSVLGILVAFLVFGFLWGIIRGFKKSLIRFITVLVFGAVALFCTPMIVNSMYDSTVVAEGLTLKGFIFKLVQDNPAITDYVSLNLIEGFALAFANLLVFFALWFLLKMVSWIIYALCSIGAYKQREDGSLPKRYRWFGGLLGMFQGLIIFTLFAIPFIGLINVLDNSSAKIFATYDSLKDVPAITSQVNLEEYDGVVGAAKDGIGAYRNSAAKKIMDYSGMSFIANFGFDHLTNVKVSSGAQVKPFKELNGVIDTVNNAIEPFISLFKLFDTLDQLSNPDFLTNLLKEDGVKELIQEIFDAIADNKMLSDLLVEQALTPLISTLGDSLPEGVTVGLNPDADNQALIKAIGGTLVSVLELVDELQVQSQVGSGSQNAEVILDIISDLGADAINGLANAINVTLPEEYTDMFTEPGGILDTIYEDGDIDSAIVEALMNWFNLTWTPTPSE
ncbi:MAG: hypothetical protein FWD32_00530 [Firmicutes bacterium]|nr:hypothetical protein [Bacillota bacterium]